MVDNLKRLGALVVGIACLWSVSNAAEQWQTVTVNEVSLAGNLKEGTTFEVQIEAKKPKLLHGDYFGGSNQPEYAVAEIVVKLGDQKISFPKQAFEDLSNP